VHGLSRPRAEQPLGAGPIAEAARTGVAVRVDDYVPSLSPLTAHDDVVGDAGPARSVLAAPMRVGTQLVGVVAVHAAAPRAFRAEDEELLRAVAGQAGTAIANARLFAESETERRQSEALAEVARAVGGSLRPGEVLRLILRHTTALLRAGGACVALERDGYLHVVAGVGVASLLSGVHLPIGTSMMGRALRERRHSISNAVPSDDRYYKPVGRVAPIEKSVIVPLISAAGPIGVISAVNREADFTDADARVLQRLADHVAVAIGNARLFEEVTTATREWKAAFDALAAGLVVLDEQGRVRRCNQRAAELCGVAGPKALLGADLREAFGLRTAAPALEPSTRDASALDVIDRAQALGEVARETLHAPARAAWLDVVAAPHPDGGTVLTFDDVTAERAHAAALARSEARYERLVESATDAIFTVDVAGRLTSVNDAVERATGRSRAELLGAPWTALGVGDEVLAATLRGERVRGEVRVSDADGAERTFSLVAAPIVEDDAVSGVLGIMRDVTDERRLAEQLAQHERLATVGRLVRGIAHELNNPLTSVVALADLLSGESPDAGDVQDAALAIRAEARRAARIVGKLHAFAQHRAPERASTDLNRVMLDALDLRRYALRMQGVDIEADLDYELPPTWADPLQLQQVFVQVVATAEESLAAVAPERRRLVARTRRRGAVVEAAFVGAFVGDERDAELAVSAEIVRAHGGRVRVERGADGGALVVELPLLAPPALGIRDAED
jgi:PAS domain S-box-containing protein